MYNTQLFFNNIRPAAEQEESDVQVSEHDPIQPPSQFPWLHVQHTPPVNAPHLQLLKQLPPQSVLQPPVQENTQLDPQELEPEIEKR